MSDTEATLIAAVQANDLERLKSLLARGDTVDAADENGWTALCWAASRGNRVAVDVLADAGADVFKCAEDRRTPYKIALAASHRDTARRLRELEQIAGSDVDRISSRENESRLYCRAYRVAELSRFAQWNALCSDSSLAPEDPVFVHQNYVVTRSIWHDRDTVLSEVTPQWRAFCDQDLGFKVPDDCDLMSV